MTRDCLGRPDSRDFRDLRDLVVMQVRPVQQEAQDLVETLDQQELRDRLDRRALLEPRVPLGPPDQPAQLGLVETSGHRVLLVHLEHQVHRAFRETLAVKEALEPLGSPGLKVQRELVEIRDQLALQDNRVLEGQTGQPGLREVQVHEEI